MIMTIKQEIRAAIKNGDNKTALKLLSKLQEPRPKKPSKLDQPYRLPFLIVR
jgi:Flp pilus assembly protein TadD